MMYLTDNMGPYKTSTMLDLIHKRPMEVKYLFRESVNIAKKLQVPVPYLETIVLQIEALQRMHHLF
jgi:ketopantoate reductase